MYTSCITGGTRDSPEGQFDFNGYIVEQVEVDHSAVVQLGDKLSMVEPLGLVVQRCEQMEPLLCRVLVFLSWFPFTTI